LSRDERCERRNREADSAGGGDESWDAGRERRASCQTSVLSRAAVATVSRADRKVAHGSGDERPLTSSGQGEGRWAGEEISTVRLQSYKVPSTGELRLHLKLHRTRHTNATPTVVDRRRYGRPQVRGVSRLYCSHRQCLIRRALKRLCRSASRCPAPTAVTGTCRGVDIDMQASNRDGPVASSST